MIPSDAQPTAVSPRSPAEPILRVENLSVEFVDGASSTRVIDDVSLDVADGETLCLVGESGSGKSVTALAVMGLLPRTARITHGRVLFKGAELGRMSDKQLRGLRGERLAMVYQEPGMAINPVQTVGKQVAEAVLRHHDVRRAVAMERAIEMLDLVGIPFARRRARDYPHSFSGGMLQRVVIAMALINEPDVVFADEPTTALDVTVQLQILDLFKRLQEQMGLALVFITHDFGVVADVADRVAVMYAGQVVERARVDELLVSPRHPYTSALLRSMPSMNVDRQVPTRLDSIPGVVPTPGNWPTGCRFSRRCAHAREACDDRAIPLQILTEGRVARCVRSDELSLEGVDR